MIIRQANKFDVENLIVLMMHYSSHSPITVLKHEHNPQHVEQLLHTLIAGMGVIWVAEKENSDIVGMIIAIRQPNIWNPSILILHELAFWVEPEYRNTSIAYRLLRAYEDSAEEEWQKGVIAGWTISKLADSEFNPSRRGYEHIESTYLKQG